MVEVRSRKYVLIPNRFFRLLELFLNVTAFFGLLLFAYFTGFLHYDFDTIGMVIVQPSPTKMHITADLDGFKYRASQADFMPSPPSSTALVLNRRITSYETMKHCPDYGKCSKKCVNFKKPNMKPSWCPNPKLLEDTRFLNIEGLELRIQTLFPKHVPEELKVARFVDHYVALNQILARLKTQEKIEDDLAKIVVRYHFYCRQNLFFWYDCEKEMIVDKAVRY